MSNILSWTHLRPTIKLKSILCSTIIHLKFLMYAFNTAYWFWIPHKVLVLSIWHFGVLLFVLCFILQTWISSTSNPIKTCLLLAHIDFNVITYRFGIYCLSCLFVFNPTSKKIYCYFCRIAVCFKIFDDTMVKDSLDLGAAHDLMNLGTTKSKQKGRILAYVDDLKDVAMRTKTLCSRLLVITLQWK